ncbi:phage tail assembly protein [Azonexus sp. R2A61]|uniref:phage tail assembly protein n=1 Tax=Azonexus sp. R2A61 TaxID=2744443 RepID=UPI001F268B87|nr:phage tail assembly protein [Azonexus sp. R2A61]
MTTSTTITLSVPLKRGDKELHDIVLHKPNSGALRGVSLRELLDMGTDAIITVVPRVSDPKITPQEMAVVEPCDLLKMGAALAGFLLPPEVLAEAEKSTQSPTV